MVKVKKIPMNTYSRKKVSKPRTIVNLNITHQTTNNIINNYFFLSKSGSGDEFDKLLKGPAFCTPTQSNPSSFSFAGKKVFQDRQETLSYYNSDATPGSFSMSSALLFKDKESPDLYSLSHLPSPPKYEKKKNKLVKIAIQQKRPIRVIKRKRRKNKRLSDSSCEMKMLTAVSSTPTHPHASPSRNKWTVLQVSPIMPLVTTTSSDSRNDSSCDMFAGEENKEHESIPEPKSDLGVSALLEGFGNLRLVTPFTKVKGNVGQRQSCDLEQNEISHSRSNIKSNEMNNITTPVRKKTKPREKQLLGEINSCNTREISNTADEVASPHEEISQRSTKTFSDSQSESNKEMVRPKSDSLITLQKRTYNKLARTNITSRRKTCLDNSFSNFKDFKILEPTKVLENESFENPKQAVNYSIKCSVDVEHGHCSSNIEKQNLDLLNNDNSAVIGSKVSVCTRLGSASLDVCTPTKTMKESLDHDIKENAQMEMNTSIHSNLEETKLNLIPGKRWRRSYSLHKRTVGRSSMEPILLAKLIKDANINNTSNKSRYSCHLLSKSITKIQGDENNASLMEISKNSLILNNTLEILNRVSIRGKVKYGKLTGYQNFNLSMDSIPEENSSPVTDEPSISRAERQQPLENSTVHLETTKTRLKSTVMDQIIEECTFEDSSDNLENSRSISLPGTPAGDKKSLLSQFSVAETPPLSKIDIDGLGTITKRRKPCRRSERSLQFLELSETDQFSDYDSSHSEDLSSSNENKSPNTESGLTPIGLFEDEKKLGALIENMDKDEFHKMGEVGVLLRCGLQSPLPFCEAFPDEVLLNCQKIGEGVYGEVFMLERPLEGKTVVKIIPVEGSQLVNNEPQKHFHEVLSELIITEELSLLREGSQNCTSGFCELKNKFCLQGCYPQRLVELWHDFDAKKGSENDCPDMFGSDQLYIALELSHSGEPVESYKFPSAKQAYSVLLQAAFSLAIAELSLEFEHRDLHIGNVLVKSTSEDYITFVHNGYRFNLPTYGAKATIIDFTLSRMLYKEDVLYFDLATDPDLFKAEGDYQFEIYRLMRSDLDNIWKNHTPITNIRWLHYLVDKFVLGVKYLNKKTKSHAQYMKKLKSMKEMFLDFLSSSDLAEFFLNTYTETISIIKEV